MGLIATGVALVAVLLVPLFGITLVRNEADFARDARGIRTSASMRCAVSAARWVAVRMTARPASSPAPAWCHGASARPMVRSSRAIASPTRCRTSSRRWPAAGGDAKLSGSNPIDVLIEFPAGASLYAPRRSTMTRRLMPRSRGRRASATSGRLETLRRWLAEKAGHADIDTLKKYVDLLPKHLQRRFLSEKQDAALVSGRIPTAIPATFCRWSTRSTAISTPCARRIPATTSRSPNAAVISARNSAGMIEKLSAWPDARIRLRGAVHRTGLPAR